MHFCFRFAIFVKIGCSSVTSRVLDNKNAMVFFFADTLRNLCQQVHFSVVVSARTHRHATTRSIVRAFVHDHNYERNLCRPKTSFIELSFYMLSSSKQIAFLISLYRSSIKISHYVHSISLLFFTFAYNFSAFLFVFLFSDLFGRVNVHNGFNNMSIVPCGMFDIHRNSVQYHIPASKTHCVLD